MLKLDCDVCDYCDLNFKINLLKIDLFENITKKYSECAKSIVAAEFVLYC